MIRRFIIWYIEKRCGGCFHFGSYGEHGKYVCIMSDWKYSGIALTRQKLKDVTKNLCAHRAAYDDLLMQVETKFPNESRHDTAKRYIKERERAYLSTPAQSEKHNSL